jgi:hypothetical protein
MITQPKTEQVQWQDLKVMSDVDLVLKIAQQHGWKDCEIFGYGDMITTPTESLGWKLFPADLCEYSIPAQGVARILQIISAGVRIQGVIIADDKRRTDPPPTPARPARPTRPARPVISLPTAKTVFSFLGKALLGLAVIAGIALIGLAMVYGFIFLVPLLILGAVMGHDPKLIILVDDGNGRMVWISVLTWFD